MAKLKFPKTLFVTVEGGDRGDDEWFNGVAAKGNISLGLGEEVEVAEYQLIGKKKFRGIMKEVQPSRR